ncbi:MAG TPA: hypothetical protein VEF33_07170 [Syntrophales bacterium]|nr:hypothetical protein [Syntrophales bacterium]
MGSKQKQTQMDQKAYFEQRLEDRLSSLSKKGIESPRIDKDTLVKKLRAKIRAINDRLKAIAANEKRTEELARIKAEKAAAPKEKEKGKEKKTKEVPEEGKVKKKKPEKAEKLEKVEVSPMEEETSKVEKPKAVPEEGKEKKKKKVKEAVEKEADKAKENE